MRKLPKEESFKYRTRPSTKKEAYDRRWQELNPDKTRAAQAKYEAANPNRHAEYRKKNPTACRDASRRFRERHKSHVQTNLKVYRRLSRYGMSETQYDYLRWVQNGVCAICRKTCSMSSVLSVDHSHDSGAIRGLLCKLCNSAIGLLRDDPQVVRAAADYLERASPRIDPTRLELLLVALNRMARNI